MKEIWKDIKGFEGIYQVSNLGNVKSLNYRNTKEEKMLTPKKNNSGYLWLELTNNKKKSCLLIHRIVALEFIPNLNNLPIVNHKDENPMNNCVDNLEWCTALQNVRYSIDLHPERTRGRKGTRRPHKYTQNVIQKTLDGKIVKEYDCTADVAIDNKFNQWSIIQCCTGKRNTAYGYKWEFVN